MEDLVGVDVADAGDELLVHQGSLQLHVALSHQLAEVVPAHGALEWIEAEMGQLVDLGLDAVELRDEHLAERARIDEPQLAALGEGDDDVGVLGHRLLGARGPPQLARPPEGDPQHLAAVELHEQVLAPSLDAHELLADQRLGELLALPVTTDRAHPGDVDGLHLLADDLLLEISPDHLDLRELRHPAPPLPRSATRPPTPEPMPHAPPPAPLASWSRPRRARTPAGRGARSRRSASRDRVPRRAPGS